MRRRVSGLSVRYLNPPAYSRWLFSAPIASAEISVAGLEGKIKDNVRLMLSLEKEKCAAPEWKIRGLYAKADQEIDQGLRALGYYHAVIKKSLAFGKDCWQADFDINPGPRVYIDGQYYHKRSGA